MNFYINRMCCPDGSITKILLVMKLIAVLITATILQASATGFAQKLTYSQKNTTIKQVFNEIRKQTGYDIVWPQGKIKSSTRIDAAFKASPLEDVLDACFVGKPVDYTIKDKTIVITEKKPTLLERIREALSAINIRGTVFDENGHPKEGVSVKIKGQNRTVYTNKTGEFTYNQVDEKAILVISYLGYKTIELPASGNLSKINLQISESKLDEVQVIAYGTTSRRLSTGGLGTVTGDELRNAPVTNPLAALESRVPGMIISQTSGVPGAAFSVQIRGRTKVDKQFGADESPLFIIDGVPMATGNNNMNLLSSAISAFSTSGLSPFSTINTGDIESIDVLKDADATAIYGSRGASGVVIITTKKGKAGATRFNIRATTGASKAPLPDMLTTSEYVAMRKEAFKNDNKVMDNTNAFDLLLWDTTRNENLTKQLIGGTARYTTAEGTVSGGGELVTYSLGGAYNRETDVYPKPMPNTRGTGHVNIDARSANHKLTANFQGTYTSSQNQSTSTDLASKVTLAPNFKLYNDDGSLAWNEGGITTIDNPLAYELQKYTAKTTNLMANMLLGYKITPQLSFRTSIGYNVTRTEELRNTPKASLNPTKTDKGSSQFGNNNFKSWITEPQLEYNRNIGKGKLNVLAGGTLQSQSNNGYSFTVRDYTSDEFLGTLTGVTSTSFINPNSFNSEYKYAAIFGRATYNYNDTYILNLSGRRDGSSRFGPNYRYSTFGAVGAAWIFTNQSFFENSILSFGKLRGSYGTTGNDKIGEYKYRDLYSSNAFGPTYNDSLALSPTSLFKPDLHWEMNKKLEIALELGFLKDRILLSAAYYRNRSNDPLVQYPLPTATGFASVTANLNGVVVQNKGLELTLTSKNISTPSFDWTTNFNVTLPQNKLLVFPDLAQTSYAKDYVIGKSLDLVYIANFLGVDPQTGLYKVADLNNNGKFDVTNVNGDLAADFDTEPSFYGGIQNDFRYKNFSLSVFMNFNKQYSKNWMLIPGSAPVGVIGSGANPFNVPSIFLSRWQNPGDITNVQKFTTVSQGNTSLNGQYAAYYSDATYENVLYLRIRTINLSYNLPQKWIKRMSMSGLSIFLQGQNLFTFAPFSDVDPESTYITRLAPLKTIVAGVQLSF